MFGLVGMETTTLAHVLVCVGALVTVIGHSTAPRAPRQVLMHKIERGGYLSVDKFEKCAACRTRRVLVRCALA